MAISLFTLLIRDPAMRLTDYTDYALRVLMYLGTRQAGLVTIQEIATAHGISKNHLTKVVHHLGLVDLVQTVRGRAGGIRLGRSPEEISLGSVVRLTEPDFDMVECFDEAHNRCALSSTCALKNALATATEAYLQRLDQITLADILRGPARSPSSSMSNRILSGNGIVARPHIKLIAS